ncbi:hypothetical protein [Pedobacter sp. SYSU D00535]|uniref:hypothetical protein n=1 Tax=Pedobacter sp. SYSU D00535 TaxID=2810308 RepID=UPI001A96D5CC|nr:hypothetical protein [Pedobacter sp. SYSU D00535]
MNALENNTTPDPENQENTSDQPVHDNTIDNSNRSANQDDGDSDIDRYNQATRASEASFTLEPEKGLTPDPDTLNSGDEKEENNIKK